jgi:hypothetical protein
LINLAYAGKPSAASSGVPSESSAAIVQRSTCPARTVCSQGTGTEKNGRGVWIDGLMTEKTIHQTASDAERKLRMR